ncbi:hypothetical protein IHQ56_02685 [Methylobacillus flagellatus]|uniref:hypothetical protein n=1 Tax=Methylobacillus flagellatus TaxID=405 RepID=UPI0028538A36|nr:hypothetical protein [Methylobacillus flagellatus]MDR5170716.1 hypothetical protein [Methylobacillus flagellatus]
MLTTYIDFRLLQWAEWRARREDSGVGFPKQSAFVRMQTQHGKFEAWTPAMNDEAAEIDQCICALIAVRQEVIMQMYTRTSTIKQKADECFCSERTFFNRLHAAKVDILGYLQDLAAGMSLPVRGPVKKIA